MRLFLGKASQMKKTFKIKPPQACHFVYQMRLPPSLQVWSAMHDDVETDSAREFDEHTVSKRAKDNHDGTHDGENKVASNRDEPRRLSHHGRANNFRPEQKTVVWTRGAE